MAGAPLWELTTMRFAHGGTWSAAYGRAFTGLHFRRFATFPQRPTRHPL